MLKYERYYPDHQVAKVFDDKSGFRILCDSYEKILNMKELGRVHVADMTGNKTIDDG